MTRQSQARRGRMEALAAMAAWLEEGRLPEGEICTRCGRLGHGHTHCTDGRVLCSRCRPTTAQTAAELCREMDAEDRREAAEDAGESPEGE